MATSSADVVESEFRNQNEKVVDFLEKAQAILLEFGEL